VNMIKGVSSSGPSGAEDGSHQYTPETMERFLMVNGKHKDNLHGYSLENNANLINE
jgi:hypothetical protein